MNGASNRPFAQWALLVVVLVWLGLVVGVSFIATPAKFLAPTLDLVVALDVGRHTFRVFAIVEAVAAIVLVGLVLLNRRIPSAVILGAAVVLSVLLQQLWLLPILDARLETMLDGGMPDTSSLHTLYVALDGLKVMLLGGLACVAS